MTNLPTSIQLYHRCKATRWTHLPVAGGWYDQHPQLIREWDILLQMDAEYEAQRRREQEVKANMPKSG